MSKLKKFVKKTLKPFGIEKKILKHEKNMFKKTNKPLKKAWDKGLKDVVKWVAIAVAVYFTAGAALGAMGSMAAGGSFMAGASAGLSSAYAGIAGAGSALMGGQIAVAGSSLTGGITGAYAAGAGTVAASTAVGTVATTAVGQTAVPTVANSATLAETGAATMSGTSTATSTAAMNTAGSNALASQGGTLASLETGIAATNTAVNTAVVNGGLTVGEVAAAGMTTGEMIQAGGLALSAYGQYQNSQGAGSYEPNNYYGMDKDGSFGMNEPGNQLGMYSAMTGTKQYATGKGQGMAEPGTQTTVNNLDDVIALKRTHPELITYS